MNPEPIYLSLPICAASCVHEQPEGNKPVCPCDGENVGRKWISISDFQGAAPNNSRGKIIQLNAADMNWHQMCRPPRRALLLTYLAVRRAAGKSYSSLTRHIFSRVLNKLTERCQAARLLNFAISSVYTKCHKAKWMCLQLPIVLENEPVHLTINGGWFQHTWLV